MKEAKGTRRSHLEPLLPRPLPVQTWWLASPFVNTACSPSHSPSLSTPQGAIGVASGEPELKVEITYVEVGLIYLAVEGKPSDVESTKQTTQPKEQSPSLLQDT